MLLTRLHQGVSPPPAANMVAWYRKGQGITEAAGAVSQWNDQSGNARHYTQATGSAQPALQGGGTIRFDGGSDFLKTAGFTLNQPFTRYLRLKQVTWTGADYICDGNTGNSAAIYQTGASPSVSLYAGATVADNTALALDTWGSLCAVYDGANSVLRINSTETTGNPGTGNPGGLTLGARGDSLQFSNIEVAEEIVYSVAHDAATQAAVIAYLNTL